MSSVKDSAPRLLVSALVTDESGRVLLTRHAPYYKWHLPDGEVRLGEKMADALVRSFREDFQVRLRVVDSRPWFVSETINEKTSLHIVTHHFHAAIVGEWKAMPRNKDLQFFWTRTDLLSVPSAHTLASTLEALDEGRRKEWHFLKEQP